MIDISRIKIGFIGAGNMAEAILKGLLESAGLLKTAVSDVSIDRLNLFKTAYGADVMPDNRQTAQFADVIILAVKPYVVKDVLTEIADIVSDKKLVVSIAAGVTIPAMEDILGNGARVVRVMPNTPALVQSGASGISAGKNATAKDTETVKTMMDCVGISVVVDESKLDAVTGLSGSGPAYVYTFIDALCDAGVKMGLTRDDARVLAAQTVLGSAKMVLDTGVHPAQLKDNVTTPGGTTITGLHELEKGKFRSTVINAVEAAACRSKELGKK
jgi:pyrroline-5-carboxylate reductase